MEYELLDLIEPCLTARRSGADRGGVRVPRGEVLPHADDHRLKFRTLVAMNALGIARRELEAASRADCGGTARGARAPRSAPAMWTRRLLGELKAARRREAPHLEPRLPREVRVTRRRLYLMRHAAVSYFENGRPRAARGRAARRTRAAEQARAAAEALEGIALRPRRHERAAAHRGDGRGSSRPTASWRRWPDLREIETGRLARIPEEELEQRVRPRVPGRRAGGGALPRAARRSARSSTACSRRSTACSRPTTGTSRSPSCTAASTARSSRGR